MRYTARTYRAVVIVWLQAWVGWLWHLPGRAWNVYRFHTEPRVDPEAFKKRIAASVARLKAQEAEILRQRQACADAATKALKPPV